VTRGKPKILFHKIIKFKLSVEKDYLIKLCLAVYKVTELFPEKESLKFFSRERANRVLADSILFFSKNPVSLTKEQEKRFSEEILGNIKVLQGYFEVAENQNWVKKENFLVLKKEYDKIEKEINKGFSKKESSDIIKKEEVPSQISFDKLKKGRYKRILEIIKEKKEAQVRDLKEIFPQISKRTIRRDFDYLLRKGLVERVGDKNRTLYKLR